MLSYMRARYRVWKFLHPSNSNETQASARNLFETADAFEVVGGYGHLPRTLRGVARRILQTGAGMNNRNWNAGKRFNMNAVRNVARNAARQARLRRVNKNINEVKLPENLNNVFNLTPFKVGDVVVRVNGRQPQYYRQTHFTNWYGNAWRNMDPNSNNAISNRPHMLTGRPISRKNVRLIKFI